MTQKIGELTQAQAKALLAWHLVRERRGPWTVFQKLLDLGYLKTADLAGLADGQYLHVTEKGKDFCFEHHKEISL